ncbi:hypothetical protein [Lysobacter sp. CA199]|uniref:hypothetical protein n=1 Tax=Lysobacter sp. CA199 TaxID=3455608 RepID=UPI003F8D4389
MQDSLSFRKVTDDRELESVAQFWGEQFRDTAPYLSQRESERTWLAFSHVFAGFSGDRVVAACRLSPFHPELGWEASMDMDAAMLERFDRSNCAQLNRVAVVREARNWRLHERLFYELAETVMRESLFDSFFSIVRETYVRLYKPWGIDAAIDSPVVLPSRSEQGYMIVQGEIARTHRLLSTALGRRRDEAEALVPA